MVVLRNSSLDYEQINWHENKMCRRIDDSYLPVTNNLDNHGTSGRSVYKINWLENKMCLNDSRQPAKNARDIYGNYGSSTCQYSASNKNNYMRRVIRQDLNEANLVNLLKYPNNRDRKSYAHRRHGRDDTLSELSTKLTIRYNKRTHKINWLKNLICHVKVDSDYTVINAYYVIVLGQRKVEVELVSTRKSLGTSTPATGRDSIPALLPAVTVKVGWLTDDCAFVFPKSMLPIMHFGHCFVCLSSNHFLHYFQRFV